MSKLTGERSVIGQYILSSFVGMVMLDLDCEKKIESHNRPEKQDMLM